MQTITTPGMNGMNMDMDMSKTTMNMGDMGHTGDMGKMKMPMPGMSMKMYFHTGFEDHILFENWTAHSDGAVFGWCVFFFLLALAYELLKYYRRLHLAKATVVNISNNVVSEENGSANNSSSTQEDQDKHIIRCGTPSGRVTRKTLPFISLAHMLQTALHMIQIFLSYILMVAFMIFNVWICLAVILGAGVGYFLVGSRKLTAYSTFEDDHCH